MKRRWLVSSVLVLSLVLALPASTQTPTHSVLVNGDFEVGIEGWESGTFGTLTHTTSTTHNGSAGAAAVTTVNAGGSNYFGSARQCIDLSSYLATWPESGGENYLTYNGYLKSNGVLSVFVAISFYTDTSCSNYLNGYTSSRSTSNDWTYHSVTTAISDIVQSVHFYLNGDGSLGTFYADDLAAFSSSTTAVESQGMAACNSLWAVGLVGVAAVSVVLGRRKKL